MKKILVTSLLLIGIFTASSIELDKPLLDLTYSDDDDSRISLLFFNSLSSFWNWAGDLGLNIFHDNICCSLNVFKETLEDMQEMQDVFRETLHAREGQLIMWFDYKKCGVSGYMWFHDPECMLCVFGDSFESQFVFKMLRAMFEVRT